MVGLSKLEIVLVVGACVLCIVYCVLYIVALGRGENTLLNVILTDE